MIGRQKEKLERLYLTYLDKLAVAKTMRENLASDIVAGYHLANVTRQMIEIEDYENTAVKNAEKEYTEYSSLFDPFEVRKFELIIHKLNTTVI